MDSWLEESFLQLLNSPVWKFHIGNFIDDNCLIFDNEEENKFPYTDIHRRYKEKIEGMLVEYMDDFGITMSQLMEACKTGLAVKYKNLFKYLVAVDDFLLFKSIMVNRNMQLNKEAERRISNQAANQRQHVIIDNQGGGARSDSKQEINKSAVSIDLDKRKMVEEDNLQEGIQRSIEDQEMAADFEKQIQQAMEESLRSYKQEQEKQNNEVGTGKETMNPAEQQPIKEENTIIKDKIPEEQNPSESVSSDPTSHDSMSPHDQTPCDSTSRDPTSCDQQHSNNAATQWLLSAIKEAKDEEIEQPTSKTQSKESESTAALIRDRTIYLKKRQTLLQEIKQKREKELQLYKQGKQTHH